MVRMALAAGAVATAILLGFRFSQDSNSVPKPALKIGVVNLQHCFDRDKYERIKDIEAELQKIADKNREELEALDKKARTAEDQCKAAQPGTRLREEKYLEWKRTEKELQLMGEWLKGKFTDLYNDRRIEVYNEIRRIVGAVGIEQKFDLVLKIEAPIIEEDRVETVSEKIHHRPVLFHDASVDVTHPVIERLNAEYKLKKATEGRSTEWNCPTCKTKIGGETCGKCGATKPK